MEHFYDNIKGWFTWPQLYKDMVAKFPSGSSFVEVGVYKGCSLSYLIVEMINANKEMSITAVDSFSENNQLNKFHSNLISVKDKYDTIVGNSWLSASKFDDKSLDFVFIDADHTYESAKKDILAWLPKVKAGGILAGHDYPTWEGVTRAVDELFKDNLNKKYVDEFCWVVEINKDIEMNDRYMDLIKAESKEAYTLYKKGAKSIFAWASHQPVLIHMLNTIKEGDVLEFGIGHYSTPIMNLICAMQGRDLLSIETDRKWFSNFVTYKGVGHDVQLIEYRDLVKWNHKLFDKRYAIAFVDGHPAQDRQPFIEKLNANYIIVHDTECVVNGVKNCYNYDFSKFKHVHHFKSHTPMTSVLSNLDVIDNDILSIFEG